MQDIKQQSLPAKLSKVFRLKEVSEIPDGGAFSYIAYLTEYYKINIYQGMLHLENSSPKLSNYFIPERTPNDIKTFSFHSRLRVMKLLSKIEFQKYGHPLFLTTTFHNIYPSNQKELKVLLSNFLKSLKRLNIKFHYIWRLELQKRNAPHFHFIILPLFNLDDKQQSNFENRIKSAWFKYLKDHNHFTYLYSCKFVKVYNRKGASRYISKYVAKLDNTKKNNRYGRLWGNSAEIKISALDTIKLSRSSFRKIKDILYNFLKSKSILSRHIEENFRTESSISLFIPVSELQNLFLENLFELSKYNELKGFIDLFIKSKVA